MIVIGHTYRVNPLRDHFQFGWEMGRIARSILHGQGFSSPTDLDTGPTAWAAPVYPYVIAGGFQAVRPVHARGSICHARIQQPLCVSYLLDDLL